MQLGRIGGEGAIGSKHCKKFLKELTQLKKSVFIYFHLRVDCSLITFL